MITVGSSTPSGVEAKSLAPEDAGRSNADGVVDVAFGVDNHFVPHMAAAIASVVANAKDAQFRFIILHAGLDEARRLAVEQLAPAMRFVWIEIAQQDIPRFKLRDLYTPAILFRLGLEQRAPSDCRRVIYLDSDLIVLRDLRELWRIDLGSSPIGAVVDTFAHAKSYPVEFAKRWDLPLDEGEYMNSGILLIDLDQVRKEKAFSKVLAFIAEQGERLLFADQDALNVVFWGRWRKLGVEWNAQRDMVIPNIAALLPEYKRLNGCSPAIVHFCDVHKPWLTSGYHPWAWLYWRYLAKTPFMREVVSTHGVTSMQRARLWLRWLRRHPALRSRAEGLSRP